MLRLLSHAGERGYSKSPSRYYFFLGMKTKGKGRDDETDQNLSAPKRELVIYLGTEQWPTERNYSLIIFF